MKKKATRKYKNGTSGVSVQNYMQTPADVIAENDIMMAQAELEAQNNPWAKGVEIGTSLLSSVAGSGDLAGMVNPDGQSFGEFFGKTKPVVAANGSSGIQGADAEVEGGETFETPTGQVGEFGGATHEKGGMPMDIVPPNQPITDGALPEQTKIYSDRILKDNKKLSDRKLDRDKKQSKLEKLIEGSADLAVKNTVQRQMKSLEREDEDDLRFQELATQFDEIAKMAFNKGEDAETQKFKNGSNGVTGLGMFDGVQTALDAILAAQNLGGTQPEETNFTPSTGDQWKQFGVETNAPEVDPSIFDKAADPEQKKGFEAYLPKAGDLVGQVGNVISAFGPMKNTLQNRAGDSPNINAFKEYGKDALTTLDKAGESLGLEKDISRQRLASQARASKKTGRAGARGIQQVRAMDLATDMASNRGEQDIDLNYAKQTMDLLSKKAGLQSQIDQVVMGGEQGADLANRQDRDAFFTQMSKDIATKGQGIQTIGKDMNQVAMNPQVLKLLEQLGKYVSYDKKGNLIAKSTS